MEAQEEPQGGIFGVGLAGTHLVHSAALGAALSLRASANAEQCQAELRREALRQPAAHSSHRGPLRSAGPFFVLRSFLGLIGQLVISAFLHAAGWDRASARVLLSFFGEATIRLSPFFLILRPVKSFTPFAFQV